jgi:hypothetical protein
MRAGKHFSGKQMKKHNLIFELRIGLQVVILSGLLAFVGCQTSKPNQDNFKPQSVIDIVHIQPFRLEKPFKFDWRRERQDVTSGLLVVFKVDTSLVVPRNELEPVLYAGNQTVLRLNQGNQSGFVIGLIPGQVDLTKEPAWFGSPALPERIDAEMISQQRKLAERAGISAIKSTDIQSKTKSPITAADLTMLLREEAANLVLQYSPQEKHLADTWRLPTTKQ